MQFFLSTGGNADSFLRPLPTRLFCEFFCYIYDFWSENNVFAQIIALNSPLEGLELGNGYGHQYLLHMHLLANVSVVLWSSVDLVVELCH